MSELLDFTGKKDFEDLKFGKGYHLTQDDISVFKEDCRRINTIHNQMALEQCKIGLLLSELKAGKTWQSVINTKTGFAYLVHSFEDFCKDAFGFSGTKTYALMQIAKFVTSNSENEVHFIDEKYSEFSSSQLTELASVPTYKRHHFTADMTIEQMRFVKKYIETDEFLEDRQKENFDLLTYANNYAESKKKPKALPASNPDVMDGQMSLFPEDNEDVEENGAEEIFPTSGKTEPGEDVKPISKEERESIIIKEALTYNEYRAIQIYKKYKSNPFHTEFVEFIKKTYGLGGSYHSGLYLDYNHKGLTIEKRTDKLTESFSAFLSWPQVTNRIVVLINHDEYLNETVKCSIDEQIKAQENKTLEVVEEIAGEEIEREYTHDVDEYDEQDEAQEDMHAEMETIEQDAEASLPVEEMKQYPYHNPSKAPYVDLSNRAKIREFLAGFDKWDSMPCFPAYMFNLCTFVFRNGMSIIAMTNKACNDLSTMKSDHSMVRYFWQLQDKTTFEVSKETIERAIPLIKDELNGGAKNE